MCRLTFQLVNRVDRVRRLENVPPPPSLLPLDMSGRFHVDVTTGLRDVWVHGLVEHFPSISSRLLVAYLKKMS